MPTQRLYTVGEEVMYAPWESADEDAVLATVIENALPDAETIEVHIDGENEPRPVPAICIIRSVDRFTSSGTLPDGETFV